MASGKRTGAKAGSGSADDRSPRLAAGSRAGVRSGAQERAARLCAADWLQAGQELLCEKGISSIKLAALTRRLGVSTGSFYHHFTDFEQYLGALADHYTVERVMIDLQVAASGDDAGPVERLQRLARRSNQAGTFDLDRAMRIWATMDPRAEAAVRRGEALVLDFIAQCFIDLGFDAAEAALRAGMLLSVNVAPFQHPAIASRADFLRGCLRLMIQDAPALLRRSSADGVNARRA